MFSIILKIILTIAIINISATPAIKSEISEIVKAGTIADFGPEKWNREESDEDEEGEDSDAEETERWNLIHPNKTQRKSHIEKSLSKHKVPTVAVSDYVKNRHTGRPVKNLK